MTSLPAMTVTGEQPTKSVDGRLLTIRLDYDDGRIEHVQCRVLGRLLIECVRLDHGADTVDAELWPAITALVRSYASETRAAQLWGAA
jgi:hypothetical protein